MEMIGIPLLVYAVHISRVPIATEPNTPPVAPAAMERTSRLIVLMRKYPHATYPSTVRMNSIVGKTMAGFCLKSAKDSEGTARKYEEMLATNAVPHAINKRHSNGTGGQESGERPQKRAKTECPMSTSTVSTAAATVTHATSSPRTETQNRSEPLPSSPVTSTTSSAPPPSSSISPYIPPPFPVPQLHEPTSVSVSNNPSSMSFFARPQEKTSSVGYPHSSDPSP
ncbi:hypothetical protein V5O48_011670 [Marasmius crinis-equi]|uniref:Uncharacterized protein n=1 Tax=Marasmius crinis-equi TaxID=585013 RepID=A0ABR3F4Y3_9AGAR